MAFTAASSNTTALRYVAESTFGVTPTSPTLQELRYTGESLNFNIQNVTSNEVRSDRSTSDLVQTGADTSGDIQIELSATSYDDFIAASIGASLTWSSAITIAPTSIAAASSTNTYTIVGAVTTGLVAGQWVKLGGFTNAANNGYKKVLTIPSSTTFTVAQTLTTESAVTGATLVVSQYVRNGANYTSFTIQKDLSLDGVNHVYFSFAGMRVGGMSLNFATGSILTGSFSFMGLAQTTSTTQISGATVNAATSTNVMNAVGNITNIFFDNAPSTSSFANLTLDIKGNLRAQDAIGSLGHVGIALGRMAITGSTKIYFDSKTLYDKFLAATEFAYAFAVQDANNKAFVFDLPRVKFSSGSVVSSGLDQDIVFDANFEALRSSGASGFMVGVYKF